LSVLRPISDDEYASWLETVIPGYAEDKVASGQWSAESALELARKEYAELLPKGKHTENNYIFSVLGAGGEVVGTLWFVAKERANRRIAYVYDIFVLPDRRRQGHAFRAFQALEREAAKLGLTGIALHVFGHNHEAQALYCKLGYVPTNINMYKPVAEANA
jgi:ribosomal protein S18 acetylase RimI-like enzyme